jgi:hypothetical protein
MLRRLHGNPETVEEHKVVLKHAKGFETKEHIVDR